MAEFITEHEVEALIDQAIGIWSHVIPNAASLLQNVQAEVRDLPDGVLGQADETTQTIWIDRDASGWGWSYDVDSGINPLSVVVHEVGHLLGFEHSDADTIDSIREIHLRQRVG